MKVALVPALFGVPLPALLGLLACLSAPAATSSADDIPALIEKLLEVDSMETFYAGNFRYSEFPPLDRAPLAAYPPPKNASPADASFRALVRLVELGPRSLPYLLQHLDDERETKTVVTDEFAKTMGPSSFIDFREDNPREASAINRAGLPRDNPGPDFDAMLDDYTLTIGDMCFTLIGMISNRSYYILVDEFDAQLNSPTRSANMATAVRDMWGPAPERIELYERLKRDLEIGSPRYSTAAARRLLYYFPSISNNLVIARLLALIEAHEPGNKDLADFLKAISWSSDGRIMSTLRRFLCTASDAAQIAVAATVYGHQPDPRGHEQLVQLADKLKLRRDPSHVKASRIILGLNLVTFPGKKEETVSRFLAGAGGYAKATACWICEGLEDAPVSALVPLLADKGESIGDRYLIHGEGSVKWPEADDYLPYRTCDRAYETISRLLGDKKAVAIGTHAEMDEKIGKLAQRLKGNPSTWSFAVAEIQARQREQNKHARAIKQ